MTMIKFMTVNTVLDDDDLYEQPKYLLLSK